MSSLSKEELIRQQQEEQELALKFVLWKYEKSGELMSLLIDIHEDESVNGYFKKVLINGVCKDAILNVWEIMQSDFSNLKNKFPMEKQNE